MRAYREAMTRFAGMGVLETWYSRISEDDLQAAVAALADHGSHKKHRRARHEGKAGSSIGVTIRRSRSSIDGHRRPGCRRLVEWPRRRPTGPLMPGLPQAAWTTPKSAGGPIGLRTIAP